MDQQWCTHSLMYLPQVFDFVFDSRSRSNHAGNNPAIESCLQKDTSVWHQFSRLKTCSRLEGKQSSSIAQ